MRPAVAAGHPATADAGAEILVKGGSAADAAVAACLASCVAETVMTGLLGGGHAIYFDASTEESWNLDFFVAVPGLGAEPRRRELVELPVPFGEELVHYAIGPASFAVPGVPAGLAALSGRFGKLPWASLVEPALRLARDGVELPPAHAACLAMLEPVMTRDRGADIYAPGGRLLGAGDRLRQPGIVRALDLVRDEGPETVYGGRIANALLDLMRERDGAVTREDLERYEEAWLEPTERPYAGRLVLTRGGISGVPETFRRLPPFDDLGGDERVVALVEALSAGAGAGGHTTNLVAVDADGSACVLTTSLGLGSGDFVPGLDLHLNSMLGEVDLLRGPLEPGARMQSMMAPTLVVDDDGPLLAIGAAGGTRLRTALVGVAAAVLAGDAPQDAVDHPRAHPAGHDVHAEPGVDETALAELETRGWHVKRWPRRHHFFGGVSLIARGGAAADPRRSGAVRRA